MQRISKVIISIFIVLLLMPYVFGVMANRHLDAFIDQANKTILKKNDVALKIIEVHRGWFSSNVLLQVSQKTQTGHDEVNNLPVTFKHGPFSFVGGHLMVGMGTFFINKVLTDKIPSLAIAVNLHVGFFDKWTAFLSLVQDKMSASSNLSPFQCSSLSLLMNGNVRTNYLTMQLLGTDLKIAAIQQKTQAALQIKKLNVKVNATLLDNQNALLVLSAKLNGFNVGVRQGGVESIPAIEAKKVILTDLQFNTQKIIKLLNEFKALEDKKNVTKKFDWIAVITLVENLSSDLVTNKTEMSVKDLSMVTILGKSSLNYKVTFPSLKEEHNFADLMASKVATFSYNIPNWGAWKYHTKINHFILGIHDLSVFSAMEGTSTQREKITLLEFRLYRSFESLKKIFPIMYLEHVFFDNQLNSDAKNTSSIMQFNVEKACFFTDCIHHFHSNIQVLNLSSVALQSTGQLWQQLIIDHAAVAGKKKHNAEAMNHLIDNSLQSITAETKVVLSNEMFLPSGSVQLRGVLSWPELLPTTPHTLESLSQKMAYQFQASVPVVSLDALLAKEEQLLKTHASLKNKHGTSPSFRTYFVQAMRDAIQKGYLKKERSSYKIHLTGNGEHVVFS